MKRTINKVLSLLVLFGLQFLSPLHASVRDTCLTAVASSPAQFLGSHITLKVLLVDFTNVHHRTSPRAYSRFEFENLFSTLGTYVSPVSYSPDGDTLFGSLGDYFQKVSNGNVIISAQVVNNVTPKGNIPVWLELPNTKGAFHAGRWIDFVNTATTLATTNGLDVGGLGPSVKLVVVYAGNVYFSSLDGVGLNPAADDGLNIYTMSERQEARATNSENPTDKFSRIGIHCHEFAHLLGLGHVAGFRADIMAAGARNGPADRGACPAPPNPAHRALKGWLSPTVVNGQQQFDAYYSLTSPQVFRINSNSNSDYFLIENRRFNQTMTIGSTTVPDFNNALYFPPAWPHGTISQGILVWRVVGGLPNDFHNTGLVFASGRFLESWPEGAPTETDDAVPFPGHRNVRVLSPWSDSRNPTPYLPPNSGIFVPTTRYGSNVGMEVLSEHQGQGYFTIALYQLAPQDASPSMPQNVAVTVLQNGGDRHPKVEWQAMSEPDLISGGRIFIFSRAKIGNGAWSGWALRDSVVGTANSWVDYVVNTAGNGPDSLQYKLQARDSQYKLSVSSDVVSIRWFMQGNKIAVVSEPSPEAFVMLQAYPNPFNPSTVITYQLPEDGFVTLKVFDVLGREVAILVNTSTTTGYYATTFDASELSSGVYFTRLTVSNLLGRQLFVKTNKLLLTK